MEVLGKRSFTPHNYSHIRESGESLVVRVLTKCPCSNPIRGDISLSHAPMHGSSYGFFGPSRFSPVDRTPKWNILDYQNKITPRFNFILHRLHNYTSHTFVIQFWWCNNKPGWTTILLLFAHMTLDQANNWKSLICTKTSAIEGHINTNSFDLLFTKHCILRVIRHIHTTLCSWQS